ncbi:hypothetical protein FO519_002213 [Halicephalobus sp. NKZ332]|nr:hypothetical protein FO519_002213 [Halicephalobus sp. NKZ332]
MIDQEFRRNGKPFDSKISSNLRDFPPLSRFDDDWETRKRDLRSYFDRDRRQQSLPPRRSYYPSTNLGRAYSPPRTTTSYRPDYSTRRTDLSSSINVPQTNFQKNFETSFQTNTDIYRKSPEVPRSALQPRASTALSRPGSPQGVAGAGDIINTENGFTIQLDVKHFEPRDIKVSLAGNGLSITGERIEDDPATAQSVKRSFSRKYAIPEDIRLESIKSHMTDTGLLVVRGNRRSWRQTDIDVHVDYGAISDV